MATNGDIRRAGCRAASWLRRRGLAGAMLLLAALAWNPLPAAEPHAPAAAPALRDYAFDRWTSRDGLPHNSIRDLAQTPDGYLWLATWEGLVRYDGLEFTIYDRSTPDPALPDNGVGALYVDPDGALWFSDSRGNLGRRTADGHWRIWHSADAGWPQVLIHAMAMDARGRLWLLFEGRGLGCLHPDGRFELVDAPAGVPLPLSFPHMAVGDDGRIWIGGLDGLVVRDPDGRLRRASRALGLPSGLAWPYRAPDGAIWLVAGDGVYRMDGARARRIHRIPGQGDFTAMLQDRHGDLWLGSESRGLLRVGARGIESPPVDAARPAGRIVQLLEDAEGSVWAGANGGLFRARETLFERLLARDGLSGNYVRALIEDDRGRLWVGGSGGLDRQGADGRLSPVTLQPGVPPSVLSLAYDARGDLWVGAYGGRVFRVREGEVVQRLDGFPGHIRAIEAAGDDEVWLATHSGPVRLVDGRPATPRAPGLPTGLVTSLAWIDGALWIGSVEGASVLENGRVRHLPLPVADGARTVFAFRRIGDAVWLATDRGLYRERNGTLARVGLEQGLPVDTVFQIVPDRIGNAWITSNRGMLRARMEDLDAVADGRLARVPIERYDEIDGMSNAQGNGSSSPSALLRRDGSVWMATAVGLSGIDPLRWKAARRRPSPLPRIESVRIDGLQVAPADGARVDSGERLSVSYVGLSFLMSERIRFRTRLEGLDTDWVERGRQRSLDVVGLPPGDYTLHVAAAHPEGDWSVRDAQWRFTVVPAWWQRRSVQALAVLLALAGLALAYRRRILRYHRAKRAAGAARRRPHTRIADPGRAVARSRQREDRTAGPPARPGRDLRAPGLRGCAHRTAQPAQFRRRARPRGRARAPAAPAAVPDDSRHRPLQGDQRRAQPRGRRRGAARNRHPAGRGVPRVRHRGADRRRGVRDHPDRRHARRGARPVRAAARCIRAPRRLGRRGRAARDDQCGASMLDPLDTAPAQLMRRADMALYRAKSAGRDRLCDI